MSTPVKENNIDNAQLEKPKVLAEFKVSSSIQQQYETALEYMRSEDYKQAISLMQKIAANEPRAAGPWVNIAIAHRKLDELEKAQNAILKSLELNPDNPYALNQAGIIMRELGKFSDSEQMYKKALAEYPNYPNAHLNLAILCDLYLQKIVCAKSHYQAYQELNKDLDKSVVAWINDLERRSARSN
ncbi:MAG: tetratricopeptide repeat protein [Pseudomonadota bacterium]